MYSSGVLVVHNETLKPLTLIKLPNHEMNRSLHVIWDQQIRSVASIDIGSSLKTIGIPRIFAESRVLGQTESIFQKLLSVQDLVGMTIEESLEELKYLQPPLAFYAAKSSKFDKLPFLTSKANGNEPKFLFHIGYGTVKSYNLEGTLQWKSECSAKWQSKLKFIRANPKIEREFTPSIKPMTLTNAFVIQGFDHISIVSETSGDELASHTLPSHPIHEPIVFGFNNDKADDVIIVTSEGLVGFSLCSTFSSVQIWIFFVSLFFTGFLFFLGISIKKFTFE